MRTARILALIISASIAQVALAADPTLGKGDYVPIVPIPTPSGGIATAGSMGDYLNALFQLAIAAGAGLAAIYIAIGGFEYIFSEAMSSKHDGRARIINALYGLMILLLVTLILYVVGGDNAIDLEIFK